MVSVDLAARTVGLGDGRSLDYTALALTTGGRPRRLRWADGTAADSLHTLEDARSLAAALRPGLRLLVVGGGFVGPNAGELAAEVGLAIEMGADVEDVALTVHAHPTMSETVGLAAELAAGTITDLPNPAVKKKPAR